MEAKSNEKLKIYSKGINNIKVTGARTTRINSMTVSELKLHRNSNTTARSFTQILKSYEVNMKSTNFKLLKNDEIPKKQLHGDDVNTRKIYNYNLSKIGFNMYIRR
jgi:hypothetical protein